MVALLVSALLPLFAGGVPIQGRVLQDGRPVPGVEVSVVAPVRYSDLPCGAGKVQACHCPDRVDGFAAAVLARSRPPLSQGVTDGLGDFSLELEGPEAWTATDLLVLAVSTDRTLAGYAPVAFLPGGTEVELLPARFHTVSVRTPPSVRAEEVTVIFNAGFGLQPAARLPGGEFRIGPLVERWAQAMAIAKGMQEAWLPLKSDDGSPQPERIVAELKPPKPLTGRVTDDGQPVAGVTVRVDSEVCPTARVTGADGNFSVARVRGLRSNQVLDVEAWKGPRSGRGRGSPASPAEIALEETGSIELTLLGPDGEPVTDAELRMLWRARKGSGHFLRATTDSAGRGTFERLPVGEGSLDLPDEWIPTKDAHLSLEEPAPVSEIIPLMRAALITGKVLDSDGRPVDGASVSVKVGESEKGSGRSFVTSRDGRFRLTGLPPGDHVVAARQSVQGVTTQKVRAPGEITLRFPANPMLDGSVMDDLGRPQARVRVEVSGGGDQRSLRSDDQGLFHLRVLPGVEYKVQAFRPGDDQPAKATVKTSGLSTEVKLVVPHRALFTGVVRDGDGQAVPHLGVFAVEPRGMSEQWVLKMLAQPNGLLPTPLPVDGEPDWTRQIQRLSGIRLVAKSQADGSFSFEESSEVFLYAAGLGFESDTAVRAGPDSREVVLQVSPRPVASGRVVDAGGRPVTRFSIGAQRFDTPDGSFRYAVPSGPRVELTITPENALGSGAVRLARRTLTVKVEREARQVDLGKITLELCFDIRGRLVVPDGTPYSRVSVAALAGDDDRAFSSISGGERGDFVLSCVPERKTRVWASTGDANGVAHVSPSTAQPIVVTVRRKGSLRVAVLDQKTGAPVQNASLEALGPEDRGPKRQHRAGSSSAQGEIVLDDLSSGTWELNVVTRCPRKTEPRFPSVRRTVHVEPEKKAEIAVRIACEE